jgi:hypothetical protein
MPAELQRLVAEASVLAGGQHPCAVLGHKWASIGGRQCPYAGEHAEPNCSQTVYQCTACDVTDYGARGGPGHRDCVVMGPCTPACAEAKACSELGERDE